jgi:hypothetical protein
MMRVTCPALIVCLVLAATAKAQVPRDPFADSPRTESPQPAAAAPDRGLPAPYVTRQREVEVPFSVRGGTTPETQPASVRVFVSWDQGRAWHLYDERRPEEGRFRFQVKQDGEFWFATQTIDRAGRPDSPEPRRPQLRLVVDTQRPQLLVQAQVQESGEVGISWSAADATLNAATLKIEYQDAATSGPWEAVAVAAKSELGRSQGQTSFHPHTGSKSLNLRAEIADAGGNIAYHSQRLSLVQPKQNLEGGLAYAPPVDPSATRWSPDAEPMMGQDRQWIASGEKTRESPASEQVRVPGMIDNPFATPGRLASSPQASRQPEEDVLPAPVENSSPPTPDSSQISPSTDSSESYDPSPSGSAVDEYGPIPANSGDGAGEPAGSSEPVHDLPSMPNTIGGSEVMPTPQPTGIPEEEPIDAPLGQRPRLTNSRRFSLDYDVETVGPDGVSAVELWGTSDGGRTWAKWGDDPDRNSPFDVEVNNESTYGFRIVIVGKSGLATSAPQSGDAADIWVGIDATRPTAHLTGAAYGQGEAAGKLDIRWEASDGNLGPRPITLAISDRPDGQFTPIAAGLPNVGQYSWEFDPRSPRQIYLRLEVRDEAGNIAIDQLTEPIKVEGLEPKGRIRGFNPAPESSREAFRSPLFQ